ncbi:phosphatase PAP2 family protein [Actinomadura flavalba]|uniref:phosphatase PAP2 family protein n=1 Tax=Actinomadura flavalba TaxID=1120938 RepID=UPI0003787054|nr:phosphatase PAP2 family protein [Actinomadura flavalba]
MGGGVGGGSEAGERRGVLATLGRIDRAAFDQVASSRLPGLEYVLPRLSRTADHGVLWFGTALALGLSRRARLRRAALRGAIGIAVASPAVNLVGKHAFRRKRPVVDLVPPVRIRWKLPTSHAFPSGHTASAAAFAAGVALEAPRRVAVPVAAAATAVAFARVYTGAHYPGDVLAGGAIGVAAAVGTRLVWPSRPPVAKITRTGTERVTSAADGQGVVIVVNPGAGGGTEQGAMVLVRDPAEAAAALLHRELPAARLVWPTPDEDLDAVLAEAAADAEVLAVIGGDGTINAGARAALKHHVPLLPVPSGTFDHFARALGIETPADALAAYRDGCLGHCDVAYVTSDSGDPALPFLNTASFGAYPELVTRRERLQGRIGKWPALAVAAVRTLRDFAPVDVTIDGRRRSVWLGFVGNCAYGSRGASPSWRMRLDDGRLDVRLVLAGTRAPRLQALAALLVGHLRLAPGYEHYDEGKLELLTHDGNLRIARDGEISTATSASVRFGKHTRELAVFCPQR